MQGIQYWADHHGRNVEVRTFFPAEFMAMNPAQARQAHAGDPGIEIRQNTGDSPGGWSS